MDRIFNNQRIRYTIEDFIKAKTQEGGYNGALIGISGGLDSATAAYLAVGALGQRNVVGLTFQFPEQITQDLKDAQKVGSILGIEHKIIDVSTLIKNFSKAVKSEKLKNKANDEYLALFERISSTLSLTWADALNYLIVSPTNRTEFLTSYYSIGGNIGHIYPLGGLFKTEVVELAKFIGVPGEIIEKPSRDGFATRKPSEVILGMPYETLDRVCYNLALGVDSGVISQNENVLHSQVEEIQRRIKDSERKLEFPECKVYMSERFEKLGKPKKKLIVTAFMRYGGG